MENVVVKSFESYNFRRYSTPWICHMFKDGSYDFSERVGTYSGNGAKGEAGDLVVYNPIKGWTYGYGQKDYRGGNTLIAYVKWTGEEFRPCDKLGRIFE